MFDEESYLWIMVKQIEKMLKHVSSRNTMRAGILTVQSDGLVRESACGMTEETRGVTAGEETPDIVR
jgi:hypothetical protein